MQKRGKIYGDGMTVIERASLRDRMHCHGLPTAVLREWRAVQAAFLAPFADLEQRMLRRRAAEKKHGVCRRQAIEHKLETLQARVFGPVRSPATGMICSYGERARPADGGRNE